MRDWILKETETHTITVTEAEIQTIYDANEPDDLVGIATDLQDLIRSRQVDLNRPYYVSLTPFNIWRGHPYFYWT